MGQTNKQKDNCLGAQMKLSGAKLLHQLTQHFRQLFRQLLYNESTTCQESGLVKTNKEILLPSDT